MKNEAEQLLSVKPENFNKFSYSKRSHFDIFHRSGYDKLFYGQEIGYKGFNIKTYQNLLIFSFIMQNIPEGSRILEIGCGDDFILNHFKYRYKFWRIEDVNLLAVSESKILKDDLNFLKDHENQYHSKIIPGYFDFVFSTTAFYDLSDEESIFESVLDKLDKFVKPGGYSLHCFPAVIVEEEQFYFHPFLGYINNKIAPIYKNVNRFIKFPVREHLLTDNDLHFVYEIFPWAKFANVKEILNTVSYNFLWGKKLLELPESAKTNNSEYLRKHPAYFFHHLMKCGGSSVTESLKTWFNLQLDLLEKSNSLNDFLRLKYNIENISSDTCITGHFQFESIHLHKRYPEIFSWKNEFKIFTFIRDPLKVKISLYYYVRNRGGFQDLNLMESLKNEENFLASLFPCNETNYKEILDRYFFIGIVEQMQESMDKLADLLNKKRINVPFSNKSDKDSQMKGITPEFIQVFKNKNKLDYLIYDYCLKKFNCV